MMKRLTVAVLALGLVAWACSGNLTGGGTGGRSLKVSLELPREGRGTSSTILPLTPPLEDLRYDALLTAPGYKPHSLSAVAYSEIKFDAVEMGTWNLEVTAKNSAGEALYRGSSELAVAREDRAVSLALFPLQETQGTLEFSLEWPEGSAEGARIFLAPDWEEIGLASSELVQGTDWVMGEDGEASLTLSKKVESGTWYLSLELTRGGITVAVVQSLVRIYDHRISSASVSLGDEEISAPPAAPSDLSLTLDPDNGDLVLNWTDNSNTEEGFRVYRDGTLVASITQPGQSHSKADRTEKSVTYKVAAYNDFGESFSKEATWGGTGTLDITFSLSLPEYGKVVFPVPEAEFLSGDELSLSPAAPENFPEAEWKWFRNGNEVTDQTDDSFLWTPAPEDVGEHIITLVVVLSDVVYSGELKITVVPGIPDTTYGVTYSFQGSDGGTVPLDLKKYKTGDTVTLLSNPGNLTKGNFRFLGWKAAADGSGVVLYPGTTVVMGEADLTFYPFWEDLVPVTGGTFQRNANSANLSAVSSFLMSRFDITRGNFEAVVGGVPDVIPSYNGSLEATPVSSNWYQAIAYCNKRSLQEGLTPVYSVTGVTDWAALKYKDIPVIDVPAWNSAGMDPAANGYRLPTVMEYMWAAMGGLEDKITGNVVQGINTGGYLKGYPGSAEAGGAQTKIGDYVWYGGGNGNNPGGKFNPVGTRQPNELGLHDLTGNIWKYCWDTSAPNTAGYLVNPQVSNNGSTRMLKGGAGGDGPENSIISRGEAFSAFVAGTRGFRVARNAPTVNWVPRAGLVGEWLMNGTGEANGVGAHGTLNGVTGGTNRKGVGNSSLEFSPAPSKMSNMILGYTPLGNGVSSDYTISLWVKFKTLQKAFLFDQSNNSHHNVNVRLDSGKVHHEVYPNSPGGLDISQSSLTAGKWYHLGIVWSNSKVKIYLNGTLDLESPTARTYTGGPITHVTLGQNARADGTILDQNWDLNGFLDDLRIYNRALSDAEIQNLSKE